MTRISHDITVYDNDDFLIDRTQNTVVVRLSDAEAMGLIAGLAKTSYEGNGQISLVIETPELYLKDRD